MSDLSAVVPILSKVGTVPSATAPQPRLVRAAHEFEAAMMKELMAPLSSGDDSLGGGDEEGSSSALNSFAQEALGKALSEHGGFGIANSIIKKLSAQSNHSGNPSVPGKSGGNAHISPSQ